MLLSLFLLSITSKTNGIFEKVFNDNIIVLDVSGSSKQRINGTMQNTKPEYAIYPWNKGYDWCSNCPKTYEEHPWIVFSLAKRKIKFNGYFVRAGCCYADRCCCDEASYYIDCCLYSWKLQISEDNKTWTDVHKIEKDDDMRLCNEKTYKLDKEYTSKYVRLIQTDACPGNPPCLALNRFDLLGDVINDDGLSDGFVSFHDDDDDVSIIGHISKNAKY